MKQILGLILSIGAVFVVNSCSDSSKQNNENVLVFWHFWSEPAQKQVLRNLIDRFESENNCKVVTTELSWNDGKTKLLASFNSKTAPDVLELGSDWVAQFSSAGVLSEISEADLSYAIPFALTPSRWDGKYYAAPWVVDTRVMFCNVAAMKKANISKVPSNVEELVLASKAISETQQEVYGFGANGADAHRLYKKILPFFWSNGGDIFDSRGTLVLNSSQNVAALEKYVELSRYGMIETQRHLDEMFVQGKIGFWISGSWLMKKIHEGNPKLEYSVSLIPGMGASSMSFAGGEYIAINKLSKKQELAEKLLKFLTKEENVVSFCKSIPEAGFPASKSNSSMSFKDVPHKEIFAQQLLLAKMTPVHPRWLEIEAILENAVTSALLGEKSAALALADAQKEAESLVMTQ
jgi:multiple sugar transport system substrate-binding protein